MILWKDVNDWLFEEKKIHIERLKHKLMKIFMFCI